MYSPLCKKTGLPFPVGQRESSSEKPGAAFPEEVGRQPPTPPPTCPQAHGSTQGRASHPPTPALRPCPFLCPTPFFSSWGKSALTLCIGPGLAVLAQTHPKLNNLMRKTLVSLSQECRVVIPVSRKTLLHVVIQGPRLMAAKLPPTCGLQGHLGITTSVNRKMGGACQVPPQEV